MCPLHQWDRLILSGILLSSHRSRVAETRDILFEIFLQVFSLLFFLIPFLKIRGLLLWGGITAHPDGDNRL